MSRKPNLTNEDGSVESLNDIPDRPAPAPFFSQVVWAGDTAYLPELIAIERAKGKLVEGGFMPDIERTFDNIGGVFAEVALALGDVARVTVYLSDISDAPRMNEIHTRRIGRYRPAREMVAVSGLAFGAKIEMTDIAYSGR